MLLGGAISAFVYQIVKNFLIFVNLFGSQIILLYSTNRFLCGKSKFCRLWQNRHIHDQVLITIS
ncbi:hypothetical protein DSECCO2_98500 [anaerobic digester metagenome]